VAHNKFLDARHPAHYIPEAATGELAVKAAKLNGSERRAAVRQDLLENLTLHSHVQMAEVLVTEQGTEDLLVPNASLEDAVM
jgi:hypothetical protein